MSLHKFADMVAKQGRGDDSLLIHMTPDEVQRLQQFAEANGRSLTINPTTGLPEAGMLSDLFKAVAPIALGAFLGPGAFGIAGMGLSAGTAGLITGGITSLATGSLSRGLMAGLGAYGGAGLAEGLASAGTGAGLSEALAGSSAGTGAQIAGDVAAAEGSSGQAFNEFLKSNANPATMSGADKFSAGLGAIKEAPMEFLKQNAMPLAAAAAPFMAGQMVPTTTKMPAETNPAYIRQKLYDPYTQTYKSLAPVKASEWGNRSFSDAYTNPQTGIAATLDNRKPTPMADGGIVALAGGGVSDQQVFDWFKANPTANDQAIAAAMQQYDVSPEQIARATGTMDKLPEYNTRFVQAVAQPGTDTSEFMAATKDVGLQNQALANALQSSGLSAASQYALTHQDIGPTANVAETGGGLEGLSSNINYIAGGLQNQIASGALTGQSAREQALTEMNKYGLNEADIRRATGKTLAELFPDTKVKPTVVIPPITTVVPGGTQLPGATVYDNGAYGNYGSGPATGVDYLGRTVSIATPGDIITNPDQTRTVVPNLPGRPYGGYTGMDQVKSAYTAGGGSLGYTAKAPRTIDEFNQLYNKQTGDSLAAYDYLMGKGAGTSGAAKYPVQSVAAATGINRPYWGEGMRYKPRFLSYGKDGELVSSTTSGKASDAGATADLTTAKTINVIDANGNPDTATLGADGKYHTSNGNTYDVTGAQIAADGGMMGYAMGGGLGSLGSYSDGGRLLKGPGDGVSDSIPATIGTKQQPARLADGEFVVPARIVSELGNGSTDAGAKKLYAMMDRVQKARGKTTGKNKVAANSRADKYLPA